MLARLATVAAVLASAGAYASSAAGAGPELSLSSNWAGYAVSGTNNTTGAATSFSVVTGSWTQPAATCAAGKATWSSFWVGLGGLSETAPALEQIGTSADCTASGTRSYSVWYEIVPGPAVDVKLKVFPGDHLTAVVVVNGGNVILRLKNLTRRTVFTKKVTAAVTDVASAEWVAEAPSSCDSAQRCEVLPLTNFGTVAFTGAAAVGDGHAGSVADGAWSATPIELLTRSASAAATGAVPSDVAPDGGSFSITYSENLPLPPG